MLQKHLVLPVLFTVILNLGLNSCSAPDNKAAITKQTIPVISVLKTPAAQEDEAQKAAAPANTATPKDNPAPTNAATPKENPVPTPTNATPPKDTTGSVPSSPLEDGKATWYAATGDGNCSLGPSPQDMMVAAMNQDQWENSQACGLCVKAHGPKGSVQLRIVDRCPECTKGHLDLSFEAFAKIAQVGGDVPQITWERVPCGYSAPMEFQVKKGSNPWWLAIQIRNHNVRISKVAIKVKTVWTEMARQSDNYFLAPAEVDQNGPYSLKIRSVDGREVEDTFPAIEPEKVFPGKTQF